MAEAEQQTATRKHMALITEHDDEERVGLIKSTEKRLSRWTKNGESPIMTFDEEAGEFNTVGKEVHLGYADFEGEPDNDEFADAVHRKLGVVDQRHLDKAGIDLEEVQE
jgi:hypothetical protein